MKKYIFCFIWLVFHHTMYGQTSFEARVEFELNDDYVDEQIIEFGEAGFLMQSRSQFAQEGMFEWKFDFYNTDLIKQNTRSIRIDKKFKSGKDVRTPETQHQMFLGPKQSFIMVSIQPSTLELTKVDGVLPKGIYLSSMTVVGDYAYFESYIKKSPHLFFINWKTGEQNLVPINIPGFKSNKIQFEYLQILKMSDEIFAFVKVPLGKFKFDMYVMRLNESGELKDMFNFSSKVTENIVSISSTKVADERYVYTGTYANQGVSSAIGLFVCESYHGEIGFIKFYNFLDLKNFLNYLPEKKQERILKKKARRESKGKEYNFDCLIASHDIMVLKDGYLMLGEAYYPTYRTVTYTSFVNGVMTTHSYQVFDGYQYTHAVLAKFDLDGNRVWDQIFEMFPRYKPFYVKRFISIIEKTDEAISMVFASNNKIVSKTISVDGDILKNETSEEIKTDFNGDKINWSFSNLDYWYDRYFIAYGSQKITNKEEKSTDKKRKVYFINKVRY